MSREKILMITPAFYGIEKSIARAFERSGFDTATVNSRTRLYFIERIFLRMSRISVFMEKIAAPVLKSFLDKDNKRYISKVREYKPDIVFIIKGETVYPDTLRVIKNRFKVPCIAYLWDCPFYSHTSHVVDIYRKNNFANGMHLYDHIFSHDPYYVDELKARGAKSVSYLPLATDPAQYKEIEMSESEKALFAYDVCFVGSPLPGRMEVLESLRGFKLGVFGDGWKTWYRIRLKKIPEYYKGKAAGEKVLKLYRSSKIVLNIHGPEAKYGVNTRTFDIPACGAFELTDYKPEMDKLFKPGEEIVYYKDIGELKRLVKFYLENPEKRLQIIEKSRAKVIISHTWLHRVREALNHIPASL